MSGSDRCRCAHKRDWHDQGGERRACAACDCDVFTEIETLDDFLTMAVNDVADWSKVGRGLAAERDVSANAPSDPPQFYTTPTASLAESITAHVWPESGTA